MGDVFDLIDHMNEEPPAHRILAWRYLKPRPSRSRSGAAAPLESKDVGELSRSLGVAPQAVPAAIRADFEWAQAQAAKLGKKKK